MTKCQITAITTMLIQFQHLLKPIDDRDRVTYARMLQCEYELEAPLNSFSDHVLNDYLYSMYKRRRLEDASLMRKLVSFL